MTFQRARSEDQRRQRRDDILQTAAGMLDEMPVAELSLNELARRCGLAKSNVLRYFETRDAVLLELYTREYDAWLDDAAARLGTRTGAEAVAEALADAAADRPRFCELCSVSASVIERNVSSEVAANYKTAAMKQARRLSSTAGWGGDLDDPRALAFVAAVNLTIAGLWSIGQPSTAMRDAYASHPELRPLRIEFAVAVRELIATFAVGLEHRSPRSS